MIDANALIKALPRMLSGDELMRALKVLPEYDSSVCSQDEAMRLIPYCELYDEGFKRLGCIGCPLGGYASQKRELERWPQYRKLYVSAFEKMVEARRQAGKIEHTALWTTGEDVLRWWMGCDPKHDPDQLSMLLEEAV